MNPDVTHAEILERMANWPSDAANSYGHALGLECRSACTAGAQALRDQVALREQIETEKRQHQTYAATIEACTTAHAETLERLESLQRDQVALRQQVETLEKQRQALYMRQESPTVDQLRDAAHGIDEGDQPSWSDMMSLLGQAANALETEELKNEALQRDQVALQEQIGDAFQHCEIMARNYQTTDPFVPTHMTILADAFAKLRQQLTACREEPKP